MIRVRVPVDTDATSMDNLCRSMSETSMTFVKMLLNSVDDLNTPFLSKAEKMDALLCSIQRLNAISIVLADGTRQIHNMLEPKLVANGYNLENSRELSKQYSIRDMEVFRESKTIFHQEVAYAPRQTDHDE